MLKRFLAGLSSLSGLFLLVASLANFFLAFRAVKIVNTHVLTNVVEVVQVSSNIVDVVGTDNVSTNSPSLAPPPAPPREVAQYPYQYFIAHKRIGAYMFGRFYYDGSPCSFGRISQVYPDRILLVDGNWISNKFADSNRDKRRMDDDR